MELSEILTLVKAGYTKDEISQMEQTTPAVSDTVPVQPVLPVSEPTTAPAPAPAPVDTPVAVAVPAPAPAPVPEVVQAPAQPSMADIMNGIAKLTSAVQANAIASSVIPQGLQNPPSAEDMLAEIIRPTFKGRGD